VECGWGSGDVDRLGCHHGFPTVLTAPGTADRVTPIPRARVSATTATYHGETENRDLPLVGVQNTEPKAGGLGRYRSYLRLEAR